MKNQTTKFGITLENVTELKTNEVFVFGSNLAGNHLAGAAKLANEKFGAELGIAEGLTGQCYAFPTLTEKLNKREISDLQQSTNALLQFVNENKDKYFIITEVGCGIAGYSHEEIAPLFKAFFPLANVSLPLSFLEIIGIKGYKAFDSGMTCKGKKYSENTLFEEDVIPIPCKKGMHFCPHPIDVLHYYSHHNTEYAEVISVGDYILDGDKITTNKLKIKGKIKFTELIKAHFEILKEKIKNSIYEVKDSKTTINTSGDYAHANTSGYYANANTSGYYANANTSGDESISSSLGVRSKAKAKKGWIVLVDWNKDEKDKWFIKDIYRAKVGRHKIKGVLIKPDVWYWIENGELKYE